MSMNILILIVFVAAMYFIMIRPQQKAQKTRQEMINNVQPGAEVVTIGGADVKIMDRFFRHREVPDSENFSKPGFQLKTV